VNGTAHCTLDLEALRQIATKFYCIYCCSNESTCNLSAWPCLLVSHQATIGRVIVEPTVAGAEARTVTDFCICLSNGDTAPCSEDSTG
jgi:hypothetical protein